MNKFEEEGFEIVATDNVIDLLRPKDEYDVYFDIGLHGTNKLIGYISYGDDSLRDIKITGNVGYGIKEKYQGNGYALRALKLIKSVLIKEDFDKILLNISPDNIASRKTAINFGAQLICYRPIPKNHSLYNYNSKHTMMVYKYDLIENEKGGKRK